MGERRGGGVKGVFEWEWVNYIIDNEFEVG